MRKTGTLLVIALGIMANCLANAEPASHLFTDHDMSLDIFGFGATRDKNGSSSGAWGSGVGFNYFFTENIGIGADSYADAFEWPYLLNVSGIFRYPIKETDFSPYAFGGVGRQWDHAAQWLGHIGIGVQYHLNLRRVSAPDLFADVREVFPTDTSVYTMLRFGLRFTFR